MGYTFQLKHNNDPFYYDKLLSYLFLYLWSILFYTWK